MILTCRQPIVSADPWPGGDFSQSLAPTLNDVLGDVPGGMGLAGTVDKGKGQGKNKGTGRGRKGKGKGDAANSSGANGEPNEQQPVEETTPIQKAKALARNVFLSCINFKTYYPYCFWDKLWQS